MSPPIQWDYLHHTEPDVSTISLGFSADTTDAHSARDTPPASDADHPGTRRAFPPPPCGEGLGVGGIPTRPARCAGLLNEMRGARRGGQTL